MTRRDLFAAGLGLAATAALGRTASAAPTLDPILKYPEWLSVRPTAASLAGKVVLLDVFTFGCYNCKNITPNLRTLHARTPSNDLAIIGIHTPETPYEREHANIVANLKAQGIVWPIALDGDSKLWRAYNVDAWPTQLIFDRKGVLRSTIVGDSQDDDVDRVIAKLIAER